MRIKLVLAAAAVGTVAAATATAALASPGASTHSVPVPSTSASAKPVHAKPVHAKPVHAKPVHAKPGHVKPAPTASASTGAGHGKPAHHKPVPAGSGHGKPGHGAPATATPSPAVTAHSRPGYPKPGHAKVVRLTVADNGKTIHVTRGEEITVKLAVDLKRNPDATTWWHPVTESGAALTALPQTLMAVRGVTNARYQAAAAGQATLSSSRAACPQHSGAPTCHSLQGWQVKIDVR